MPLAASPSVNPPIDPIGRINHIPVLVIKLYVIICPIMVGIHQWLSILMNHCQSLSIIFNHYQSLSIIINHYQSLLIIIHQPWMISSYCSKGNMGVSENEVLHEPSTQFIIIFPPIIYIYWLVVSNMSYMGCHPSHWQTHIFQDGYCTTNRWYITKVSNLSVHS